MPGRRGAGRFSRRDVVKGMAVGAGAAALGSFPIRLGAEDAAAGSELRFVLAYFRGGWDLLLGLDPRDPRRFHDGNAAVTGIRPAYHLVDRPGLPVEPVRTASGLTLGPAAAPLAGHAERLAVVRGLDMQTLVHGAGRRRFLTGRSAAVRGGASIAGRLAAAGGAPGARVLIGVEPEGGEPADGVLTVRSAADLPAAVRLSPAEAAGLDAGEPFARAKAAARAIASGAARVVTVEVASGLDTHGGDWRRDHFRRLERGFSAVAAIADELERTPRPDSFGGLAGGTWLDRTVIVGFSELGRSPLLNAGGGRDHHVANACFVLGGPVRGGRALGATSDDGMRPLAVDPATGRPAPGGRPLRPEHVLQALLETAGCERGAGLGVPPLAALFA